MASRVTEASRRPRRIGLALRGARRGRPDTGGESEGSREIRHLVEEPYRSVGETHRRLTELLEAFDARGDRRSAFLTIYARVTGAVGDRVESGWFDDPEWVADYLVAFANLYREAVLDFEAGRLEALADPWQIAFEAAETEACHVLQDVALGINAHINYDLALALDEVGIDPDRRRKRDDHRAVTDVLRRLVDENQDTLAEKYDPTIADLDELLGELDELFSVLAIDECRDSAWRTAVALDSALPVRRRFAMWVTRATSTGAAYLIRGA
ncbi:MAG: DUF5995 family protein [Haloarculaceae archaeon]|jgi:hypothetical protein